jgi:hypothetical protein
LESSFQEKAEKRKTAVGSHMWCWLHCVMCEWLYPIDPFAEVNEPGSEKWKFVPSAVSEVAR